MLVSFSETERVCGAHFRLQSVGTLLLSVERLLQHVDVLLAVGVLIGQRLQLGLQRLHLRLLLVQLLFLLFYLTHKEMTKGNLSVC